MTKTDFDFDQLPQRRGTSSIKWDRYPNHAPYWVADMDFPSPKCVIDALHSRVEHGVFGYANANSGLVEAVLAYLRTMHEVSVDEEALIHLPGMVPALSLACRAFTSPGDSVMINSPVYYPFFQVAKDAGSTIIDVPHIRNDTTWQFDWEGMEAAVTENTKILMLCNPQNPLGHAFSETEILRVGEFCVRHDLVLIADEIHCDLILDPEQKHYSVLRLPESSRPRLVTLMAPSKTYNIAGIGYSFAVIQNEELRRQFLNARGCTMPEINLFAMVAAEAAYRNGESWRRALVTYLRENSSMLKRFIREEIQTLRVYEQSATYLCWIDCSSLNVLNPCRFFFEEAGLQLTDGTPFGSPQHVRFNFGCPRNHMLKGLQAMKQAVAKRDAELKQ